MTAQTEVEERTPQEFGDIGHGFAHGIQAVRVFSEKIGPLADEHDERALNDFVDGLEKVLGESIRTEEDPPELPAIEGRNEADSSTKSGTDSQESDSGDEGSSMRDERNNTPPGLRNPEGRRQFIKHVKAFSKSPPVQGSLLRRGALTSLFSTFEVLIAELLHAYYLRFPSALPAADRTLTLEELREIGSLVEAERFLISREVDSVLRESILSQLEYFTKRLKINLGPVSDIEAQVIEIAQRRNLMVHNAGIVNKTYLKKVPAEVRPDDIEEGKQLQVSTEYLGDAIDILFAVGAILLQQCWRKWAPEDETGADDWAIESTFDSLVDERYALVERLAAFYAHTGLMSDAANRIVMVNKAIAIRDSGGSQDDVDELVDSLDWSTCGPRYLLARWALKADEDAFFRLAKRALRNGEIQADELQEWPLFARMRDTEAWGGLAEDIERASKKVIDLEANS